MYSDNLLFQMIGGGFFIAYLVWMVLTIVQNILNYGTAYRLTKRGGDNGIALYGWILVMSLASFVPGLGLYLWFRYRHE